jgi:hypothetical protein
MCMFSGSVKDVYGTQIFARAENGVRQLLVYGMTVSSHQHCYRKALEGTLPNRDIVVG